ncbi:MAG TPA: 2Fe-2S iron-sulfur cluster binding domain-containing protein [Pseudomonas xinjiangensis]|uniref:2Fe-2S iron-sulfur cluster binding domain-containing protein n=2 Tax=root TaxID=1 RepID=A0A7V1FT54_9GAMM|nr:2Fe-2S iron-sulfur cluster binding domain-containing protein [Pseudomonas sp.]HDZ57648.1 2Fe-2S iron-sulfur cluster binding domain-containing protein [Halopseudomonas xinjiangensis]HEC47192.1 2Fe-2S iron-sulfur cluster binding domain-containing protein [Halopseudomonas xinjiangensis]
MTVNYEITERVSGSRFSCEPEQSVLKAMEQRAKRCVPVGCRGGGCGLCKVQVISGEYHCGPMSRKHVSDAALACGEALACRLYPLSDLMIECRTPKAAAEIQQQIQ